MSLIVGSITDAGRYSFAWPDGSVEEFTRSWEGEVVADGRRIRFRHGLGRRLVYGRERVHSVTWLDGQPTIEGVEADDHERSLALLCRIKRADGKLARHEGEVPAGYEAFEVVNHRDEIAAPYSPRGLAVKLIATDVESWVKLAVLRRGSKASAAPAWHRPRASSVPVQRFEPITWSTKRAVADALIAFEEREHGPLRQAARALTPEQDAEALVREDSFALLLAVIFDQGVDFQRAWRAPLILRERLGHCDPARMVADPSSVHRAVSTRPMLGRFHNRLGRWAVAAAQRVIDVYGGEARMIWEDVTARELQARLDAFPGIDQKKAAMATMLLWRFMDVPVREMSGCDVAVDVHIRRVFLRSGMVERDAVSDIVTAARDLYPALPGALDPPAWTVGKTWCRPSSPDCPACPLGSACPRLIDRAAGVTGG